MSSFMKAQKRQSEHSSAKETKKRIEHIYKIMGELDNIADEMIAHGEEVNEDNIVEIASNYTDLKIGKYESLILLGKLTKDEVEPNNN